MSCLWHFENVIDLLERKVFVCFIPHPIFPNALQVCDVYPHISPLIFVISSLVLDFRMIGYAESCLAFARLSTPQDLQLFNPLEHLFHWPSLC
jgi:hypothetical protein